MSGKWLESGSNFACLRVKKLFTFYSDPGYGVKKRFQFFSEYGYARLQYTKFGGQCTILFLKSSG